MPHRRKNKTNFCPQLQFDPQDSYLYLSYSEEDDSSISVSLDTFVIIFSIKFCEIKNIKIRYKYKILDKMTRSDKNYVSKN